MKTLKRLAVVITIGLLTIGFTLNFSGCSKDSPLQPNKSDNQISEEKFSLAKPAAGAYPQETWRTYQYKKNKGYSGGNMQVNSGSTFHIEEGALTPPSEIQIGDPVKLTMTVERDKFRTELIFTFGPHGSTFDPPAEVWFDWKDLHSPNATLYYIQEDGTRVPHAPDYVDMQGKRMKIYVDHFSRYAVGSE